MAIQTVKVQIDGVWHTLTFNATSGKYEKTITAPSITSYNLAGSYYPVTAEVTNTAGTIVTKGSTDPTLGTSLRLVVKEVTKPTITIISPGAGATVTNNKQPISFQLRDEANGSGVSIGTLQVQIDGGSILTNTSPGMAVTSVTGGYNVTYTPPSALSDGDHTITINIDDNDGNSATEASRTFTIDTVAPTLSVTAPSPDFITNNPSINISGTTNDVTSSPVTVTVKLNGVDQGAVNVTSGSFNKAITLSEGANMIVVRATDGAGKFTEVTVEGTLDTSVPQITAVSISPNPSDVGGSVLIELTVSG